MEETAVVVEEVARLADEELIAGLQRWVRADRSVTARLLVHLGEVDARGLYRERAWPSMFTYAVEELHMSESEAYLRIAAARLGRLFPRVVELVAEGAVHLTAVKLLGPHLTVDNHMRVLERARGKATREIKRLVAELAPQSDVPSRMRKLPVPVSTQSTGIHVAPQPEANTASNPLLAASSQTQTRSSPASSQTQTGSSLASSETHADSSLLTRSASAAQSKEIAGASHLASNDGAHFQLAPVPRKVSSTTPLRPGRYKVEFTAGEAMHDKLEQLKALLRHQVPDGDLAIILERAADLLLEKTLKARFAQTTHRRASKARGSKAPACADSVRDARVAAAHTSEAAAGTACAGEAESRAACDGELSTTRASADSAHKARAIAAHTSAAAVNGACGDAGSRAVRDEDSVSPAEANGIDSVGLRRAPSRYIPRSVVREVHARDAGQCTFVSPDGRRCCERGFLELHHDDMPYARGGAATAENLKLACRTHNALLAERDFGRAFIHSKLAQAQLRKRDGAHRLVSQREHE